MEPSSPLPAPSLRSFRLRAPQAGLHPVLGGLALALALAGIYGLVALARSGELGGRLVALAGPPPAASATNPVARPLRVPLDPPLATEGGPEVPAAPLAGYAAVSPASVPEAGARRVIGPEAAALRAQPSPSAPLVVTLDSGTIVEELPDDTASGEPDWRRVRWNGQEGWVAAALLRPLP